MSNKAWIGAILAMMGGASIAQDINFADLQRPGRPAVKSYPVSGLAADAAERLAMFDDIDTDERRARAAAISSASTSTSSTGDGQAKQSKQTSASKPQPQPQARQFVCTVYCKSTSGPTTRYELTAMSRAEAARTVGDIADQICNARGMSHASSRALPEGQCSQR